MPNNRVICIIAGFLLTLAPVSCSFDASQLMPPGAMGTPVNSTPNVSGALSTEDSTNTQPSVETAFPLSEIVIHGNWRCHIEPNALSDTLIFLHDGEIVKLQEIDQNGWILIQAGSKICYLKAEAMQ